MRTFRWLFPALCAPLSLFAQASGEANDAKTLSELEQQIDPLKEQVFETKVRLQDLKKAVFEGKITGSKALITFDNQAEGFFALTTIEFFLDDQLVKKFTPPKGGPAPKSVRVFDGDLPAGDHVIKTLATFRGSDRSIYAAFAYFKDHTFKATLTEKFGVEYGKTSIVKLIALDKGYFKTDVRERLSLDAKVVKDWGNAEEPSP
jgi:hypothetical protein